MTFLPSPKRLLPALAELEGGQVSKVQSKTPKDIFKKNYSDIRKADKIVQYMDDVPTTLDEATEILGGSTQDQKHI